MVEVILVKKNRTEYFKTDHVEIYEDSEGYTHIRISIRGTKIKYRDEGLETYYPDDADYRLPEIYDLDSMIKQLITAVKEGTPIILDLEA